jgi:predicted Zn-ribbon and HTH transcriptional regulator
LDAVAHRSEPIALEHASRDGGGISRGMPWRESPNAPAERSSTLRVQLHVLLRHGPARTALELAQEIGVREREIALHLEHLERSLKNENERLVVEVPTCVACGFVFHGRHRLTRPGKCPRCRATRVLPPRFRIVSVGEDR